MAPCIFVWWKMIWLKFPCTITTACNRPDLQAIQSRCPSQSIPLQRFTVTSGLRSENSSNPAGHVLQPALPLPSSRWDHSWKVWLPPPKTQPQSSPRSEQSCQLQVGCCLEQQKVPCLTHIFWSLYCCDTIKKKIQPSNGEYSLLTVLMLFYDYIVLDFAV